MRPQDTLFQLSSERDKLRLLAATGLDGAIVMTFDARLPPPRRTISSNASWSDASASAARRSASIFISGRTAPARRPISPEQGARLGFAVDIVPPLEDEGRPVSSGAVRAALSQGKVVEAAELLGAPWFVSGEVIHGDKRGRELGFPTANLKLDPACGLKHGIYAVRVGIGDKRHDGVASFGVRPMFDDGAPLLEVFLFDFDGDLYGQTIDVAFIGWIRHEQKFESIETLKRHMMADARPGPRRAQARRQGVSDVGGGLGFPQCRGRPCEAGDPERLCLPTFTTVCSLFRSACKCSAGTTASAFPPRNPPAT